MPHEAEEAIQDKYINMVLYACELHSIQTIICVTTKKLQGRL